MRTPVADAAVTAAAMGLAAAVPVLGTRPPRPPPHRYRLPTLTHAMPHRAHAAAPCPACSSASPVGAPPPPIPSLSSHPPPLPRPLSGFGFVTLATAELAETAIARMNNSDVDGRQVRVDLASSRQS